MIIPGPARMYTELRALCSKLNDWQGSKSVAKVEEWSGWQLLLIVWDGDNKKLDTELTPHAPVVISLDPRWALGVNDSNNSNMATRLLLIRGYGKSGINALLWRTISYSRTKPNHQFCFSTSSTLASIYPIFLRNTCRTRPSFLQVLLLTKYLPYETFLPTSPPSYKIPAVWDLPTSPPPYKIPTVWDLSIKPSNESSSL